MKVQPIDPTPAAPAPAPAAKSRLKRLFERQVMRISPAERLPAAAAGGDVEPTSVCLDGMVRNFLEEGAEKAPAARCGPRCRNCFHAGCGGAGDSSDDDLDLAAPGDSSTGDAAEAIKGVVHCASLRERNLLADVAALVERHRAAARRKRDLLRLVAPALRALGHDAAVCRSRWDKAPSHPSGEYEYLDVLFPGTGADGGEGERVLVDVDFRSEFEIARSTKAYRAVLQRLPPVFVGKEDRLRLIVAAAAEAARASLKKKGLHFPPWRKPEYMRAKWLSPYEREQPPPSSPAEVAAWEPSPAMSPEKDVVTGLASAFKERT